MFFLQNAFVLFGKKILNVKIKLCEKARLISPYTSLKKQTNSVRADCSCKGKAFASAREKTRLLFASVFSLALVNLGRILFFGVVFGSSKTMTKNRICVNVRKAL